jgi:hypothetical protein
MALTSCIFPEDACDESIQQQIKSDALSILITISKRDCGATTLPATNVYIKEINAMKNKFGDRVYTARRATKTDVFVSGNSIVIQSDASTDDVFLKFDRWRNVDIIYR